MMLGRWILPIVVLAGFTVDPPPRPATSCSCFESFEESVDGFVSADFVFLAKAMDVEPRSQAYDMGTRSVLFAIQEVYRGAPLDTLRYTTSSCDSFSNGDYFLVGLYSSGAGFEGRHCYNGVVATNRHRDRVLAMDPVWERSTDLRPSGVFSPPGSSPDSGTRVEVTIGLHASLNSDPPDRVAVGPHVIDFSGVTSSRVLLNSGPYIVRLHWNDGREFDEEAWVGCAHHRALRSETGICLGEWVVGFPKLDRGPL